MQSLALGLARISEEGVQTRGRAGEGGASPRMTAEERERWGAVAPEDIGKAESSRYGLLVADRAETAAVAPPPSRLRAWVAFYRVPKVKFLSRTLSHLLQIASYLVTLLWFELELVQGADGASGASGASGGNNAAAHFVVPYPRLWPEGVWFTYTLALELDALYQVKEG